MLRCLSGNDTVTSTQLQHGLELLLQLDSKGPDLAGQPANRLQWVLKRKVAPGTLHSAMLHLDAFIQVLVSMCHSSNSGLAGRHGLPGSCSAAGAVAHPGSFLSTSNWHKSCTS